MKSVLFAANWKLNKGPRETRTFFEDFKSRISSELESKVIFFVPATSLDVTSVALTGTKMSFGSQNCYSQASGAYTGEISAQVVQEMGGRYILIGHSERRQIFNESDDFIAAKGRLVQGLGLTPMLCIGETLEQRQQGLTQKVCESQLRLFMQTIDLAKNWVVAYEPVWAIGTGKVATLEQVAETHSQIRTFISEQGGAKDTSILYGGSVKPENASELLKISDVNGFLVGGASLDPVSFHKICLA